MDGTSLQIPAFGLTKASVKFEVATSNSLGRSCIYKEIHYLTLTLGSKSYETLPAQYPLYRVTYAPAKFKVSMSNG